MSTVKFHHVAISVADTTRSIQFYEMFGFRLALQWRATDGSVTLAHLVHPDHVMLEIVSYGTNAGKQGATQGVGNNLDQIGVKHFGLHVDDVAELRRELEAKGIGEMTEIQLGRTGFDLFFVKDPDGIWLELLSDHRTLDADNPKFIEEEPRLLPGE